MRRWWQHARTLLSPAYIETWKIPTYNLRSLVSIRTVCFSPPPPNARALNFHSDSYRSSAAISHPHYPHSVLKPDIRRTHIQIYTRFTKRTRKIFSCPGTFSRLQACTHRIYLRKACFERVCRAHHQRAFIKLDDFTANTTASVVSVVWLAPHIYIRVVYALCTHSSRTCVWNVYRKILWCVSHSS